MALGPNQLAWVEALESGEYKQGKGVLNRNDEFFCCLGVGCEVAIKAGVQLVKREEKDGSISYDYRCAYPPEAVQEWLGILSDSGVYRLPDDQWSLTADNDYGKTFAQIAEIIRSEPEGLLKQSK